MIKKDGRFKKNKCPKGGCEALIRDRDTFCSKHFIEYRKENNLCILCGDKKDNNINNCDPCAAKCRKTQKENYNKDKEKIRNKKRIRQILDGNSRRHKKRYKEDIAYRLKYNLKNRLKSFLRKMKEGKKISFSKSLGCDTDFFKNYMEFLFEDGMGWDNYGDNGWHIDHIIPLSRFDLTSKEQQWIANNYQNLQPMWSTENIKKGNDVFEDVLDHHVIWVDDGAYIIERCDTKESEND